MRTLITIALGAVFGLTLIYAQAFHWYRIQEMFHFESFHMFGLLFSAIGTGVVSVFVLKRVKAKSVYGNTIETNKKPLQLSANIGGGILFGIGWALSGACTAPTFLLLGLEWKIGLIVLAGAIGGVLLYGAVNHKLPK